MFSDPIPLDLLARLRPRPAATLLAARPAAKAAFSPAPAVQQAVMGQAQAGGVPPGAPPPGDPAAAGVVGPPPPGDPAAAGVVGPPPPGDPGVPPGPNPDVLEIKQMLQQFLQAQTGSSGSPGGGKPATVSMKIEPSHFHQVVHDIASMRAVLTQLVDQLGLEVPASTLLHQPAPGQPGPAAGDPAPAGPPAGPAPFAQQLPTLPPAAAKAASPAVARSPLAAEALHRLSAGFLVGGPDSPGGGAGPTARLAAFVASRAAAGDSPWH